MFLVAKRRSFGLRAASPAARATRPRRRLLRRAERAAALEGKTPLAAGSLELAALALAEELTAKRERVLAALVARAPQQRGRALKGSG